MVLLGLLTRTSTPPEAVALLAVVVAVSTTAHRQLAYRLGAATAWAGVGVIWAVVTWGLASQTGLMCENTTTGFGRGCTTDEAFEWVFFAAFLGVVAATAKPVLRMAMSLSRKMLTLAWSAVLSAANLAGFEEPARPSRTQVAVCFGLATTGYLAASVAGFERVGAIMVAALLSTVPVLWSVGTRFKAEDGSRQRKPRAVRKVNVPVNKTNGKQKP
jgi:hypothetical protein